MALNKKTVDDINAKGKRVLVRCDFNVPLKDGVITDETRIVAALPTIKKLIGDGAKVILCSHLGKVKNGPNEGESLAPVAKRLSEKLGKEVVFVSDYHVTGEAATKAVSEMKDGDVVLLQNTRFRGAEETKNGEEFSKELADLADIYVCDAFGSSHRAHASVAGVTKFISAKGGQNVVGYLMEKEINFLGNAVENPVRPFVAILGGAKVADKLNVISNLLEKCDTLIIGGGMAYTFLKAQGAEVGRCDLVEYLIGSLDDDGLLRKSLESICDELAIYAGIESTEEELEEALNILQDFDPAGIGARSLQECLLIQIRRKKEEEKTPSPILNLEERIIRECYEEFTRKHWEKIIKKLDIDEETFQETITEITKLNPRPGASLGEAIGRNLQQIVPDFIVETYDDGTINVSLNNRNVPELRMSRDFTEMVEEHTKNRANQSKESKEAMMFLKQKMDAAQGFIDAVRQRQNTLMVTMQAIIDLQRPFFLEGDESLLKPMILKDVAERTGLDISTISRVSNSKYVQTNYGIYPLKYFFSDGYTTEDGEEMSVREIRKILKECIEGEDKKKPLTDDELADILKEKGYPIARRTVAKYRQQLNIPVARLRK